MRVICDFDGTIALGDVTDILLERFALPDWQRIEDEWKQGAIGSRECMTRQVDLLRVTPAALNDCLDRVAIDPAFPAFVVQAARLGADLLVVSDGLDYAISRILGRFGLHTLPILANRLEQVGPDRWRLGFPHATDACVKGAGTCKCAIAERAEPGRLRLLIGDGASDFCAATAVHLTLAKDRLLDHCRDRDLPHVAFADFAEAARLLADLAGGAGPAHPVPVPEFPSE